MNAMHGFMVLVFLVTGSLAWGKEASLGAMKFDIDPTWKCDPQESELVCLKDGDPAPQKEMIVITSRKRLKDDNLAQFKVHLQKPKEFAGPDKRLFKSEVKYVKEVKIGSLTWIDSLQYQSEVPQYFTRYLATVNGRNAVIATFSGKKEVFDALNASVAKIMATVRIAP